MTDDYKKTQAMRVLEGQDVPYEVIVFPEDVHDARGVADYAGLSPAEVYKTLVVEDDVPGAKPMLIMVAGDRELNLKQVAQSIGAKKVRMARYEDAERMTGLEVGGISALALLNQGFNIYIDQPALAHDHIVISAGQRGLNIKVPVEDLIAVTDAEVIQASQRRET